MYSFYSPLFTLGLLAEHSPAASPTSPVESTHDDFPIYFTLKAGTRDSVELRSFLYLDLADNKQLAPSRRRKFSLLSKSTSWTCTADAKSTHDFAYVLYVISQHHVSHPLRRTEKPMIMSPTPVVPARRRTSKESLRNIPSPKPAPSTTLPDVPTVSRPRLPPLSTPPSAFKKRAASSSLLPPTPRVRRPVSMRSESISSQDRRKSRMDALACLEGRSRAPNRVPRSSALRNNFMSFSDDEDDKSTPRKSTAPSAIQIEDQSAFADVEDEVDAVVAAPVRKRGVSEQAKPTRPAKPARKRRGTLESWFPLKSFIDLKDDDTSSWNWRSFIEIGGVS